MSKFKPTKWLFPPIKKAFSFSFSGIKNDGLFSSMGHIIKTAYDILMKKDDKKIVDKSIGWKERWGLTLLNEDEFDHMLRVMRFEIRLSLVVVGIASLLFLFYIFSRIWLGVFFSSMVMLYAFPSMLLTMWRLNVVTNDTYMTFNEWIKKT